MIGVDFDRLGSSTDLSAPKSNFRFAPESGLKSDTALRPGWANNGLMHRGKQRRYSITSSARPGSESGTVMPNALAALLVWKFDGTLLGLDDVG